MTARTFTVPVVASTGLPTWYSGLSPLNWNVLPTTTGTNRGATADVVWPAGLSVTSVYGHTALPADPFTSWSGACVDQTRGDLLLVANGGHASNGWANHALALRVRAEVPGWYRLNDPTPATVASQGLENLPAWPDNNYYGSWPDGRSRAMHCGSMPVFQGGKVWFLNQAAINFSGGDARMIVNFNRSHVNTINGQQMPSGPGDAPQTYEQNAGPWTSTGVLTSWLGYYSNGYIQFAIDPVTGAAFSTDTFDERLQSTLSLRVTLGTTPVIQTSPISVNMRRNMGIAIASDYETTGQDRWRYAVSFSGGASGPRQLYIWDMKVSATCPTPVAVNCSDTSWMSFTHYSAFYHPPSRSILFAEPYWAQSTLPIYTGDAVAAAYVNKIVKVRVPTNADGSYNASGTWQVSAISPSGNPAAGMLFPTSSSQDGLKAYTRCNIVQMNGTSWAMVAALRNDGSAYIMPLPTGDF